MRDISVITARARRWKTVAAGAFLLAAGLSLPCHAQSPGMAGPGGVAPPQSPPQAQGIPASLPPGVRQLFALQGTNDLLAMATPDGYDRLRELVRNLDGDLDAIRTRVVSVDATTGDLATLGMTVGSGTPTLTAQDEAKLMSALQAGSLRVTETLRITTRENTPVDTLLRNAGARYATGGTPFMLIPREDKNGLVTLEIHQPIDSQRAVPSGQTAVIALPGATVGAVRLLFLTPSVLPSASRPMR